MRREGLAQRALRLATSLPGRIAITVLLLALVARSIDWDALGETLRGVSWVLFALVVATLIATFVIAALRWRPLLASAGIPAPFLLSQRAYFVGAFTNNLLPTGFGGDVVRAWLLARRGPALARSLTSVVVDRVSALGCLVLVGWVAIAIDPGAVPGELVVLLAAATVAGCAGAAAVVAVLPRPGLARFLPGSLRPWAAEVAHVLRDYSGDRSLQVRVLVLGVAFQALTVLAFWLLAEALDLGVSAAALAVALPLVLIAMLAPITIAGFGMREGAFVVLLGEVGVSANDATLLSLLSVAAMAIASLPGGIMLLARHERPHVPAGAFERR